jgi:transposase
LLKANLNQEDRGWSERAISQALNISTRTIERVRQRFVEEGLDSALIPRPKTSLKLRKIDGEMEAHLVAIACSQAPTGYNRWTLRVVQDNLNTHVKASLYKAFTPAEARRILDKLEFHYTPKHGSWLNMAEIELSVLNRQCLDRRIPDKDVLTEEVAAWEKRRHQNSSPVDWRFTTEDARIKLKRLYPSVPS